MTARSATFAAIFFLLAGTALASTPELPAGCSVESLKADIASCDRAIAAEGDPAAKSTLLFRRAYALVEKYKYEEALRDLDQALLLDPDSADVLHERAYVLGELSEFGRALADLDREVAIRPDWPDAYQERAFARQWTGDFAGAWADRNRQVALRPEDPQLLLARADQAIWLGRYEDASRDVAAAEALARNSGKGDSLQRIETTRQRIASVSTRTPGGSPDARCRAADKENAFDRANLIGDCTAAFLAAPDNKAKAEILTIRSVAWLIQRSDTASSAADRRIAVSLDPGNADWHSNLGFAYIEIRHSWAAEREFNRALAIRENWVALGGRASARYNLNRKDEAFADAKKSFELQPNGLALTVLGDISFDRSDRGAAKRYWMAAYHLGARDDGLIASLRRVGVEHPESEPR